MKARLGNRSKFNLCNNLDYRLVHIVCEVLKREVNCDFGVFETKRTLEKQKEYIKRGVSKTLNSKHIPNTLGIVNAMDIVPYIDGKYSWDRVALEELMRTFKEVANELYPNEIQFGMDWVTFKDYPHVEIKKRYWIRG